MHLTIDFVAGDNVYIYTHSNRLLMDTNTSLECLWRTFMHYEDTHGALPANLYLQLDNTTRENRNNVLFGFMASLKERDVFDKIILGFLPIGHTHNEPDQVKHIFLLSCVSGCKPLFYRVPNARYPVIGSFARDPSHVL